MELCSNQGMGLLYLIIFTTSFSVFSVDPLINQYVYLKVAKSLNATDRSGATSCDGNSTDLEMLVSQEASRWGLYLSIALFIPAGLSGVVITTWGDRVGRKVTMALTLSGMILENLSFALITVFDWPLRSLFVTSVLAGCTGYYTTLFMQAVAYVSDVTEPEKRGLKLVIIETCFGIGGGVGGIASGYWLSSKGFFQPIAFSFVLGGLSFLLIFFLPESSKIKGNKPKSIETMQCDATKHDAPPEIFEDLCHNSIDHDDVQIKESTTLLKTRQTTLSTYGSCSNSSPKDNNETQVTQRCLRDTLRAIWNVYTTEYSHCERCHGDRNQNTNYPEDICPHGGGAYPGRIWKLWCYLVIDNIYMFVSCGTWNIQSFYFLSPPLCFTPVLIGIQLGFWYALELVAPLLVMLYQQVLHISNNTIILIALLAYVASNTIMAFAVKSFIVFIATAFTGISNPVRPFVQTQVSKLVSEDEQSLAFSLLLFSETMIYMLASAVFFVIYPDTMEMYNGFVWLFAAGVTCIPVGIVIIIMMKNRKLDQPPGGSQAPVTT